MTMSSARRQGTEWDFSIDWLSDRGLGHGTTYAYNSNNIFGSANPGAGIIDFWGIYDTGFDNLGQGRRHVPLYENYRYRLLAKHRQKIWGDVQLTGEVGLISDRNFLEQYFEREWDEQKDQTTGVEIRRPTNNRSWSVSADVRPNPFFTQTEWWPRGDHYWLGESILGGLLTWYEHSTVGYGRLRKADAPKFPEEQPWHLLPWEENNREGIQFTTRHELNAPMQAGPVRVTPYLLGELAYWGENISGDSTERFYWRGGVRASLPMWKVDTSIESRLLNVHGLAHKMTFEADLGYSDADQDLDSLVLYTPLDDDSIEAYRRTLVPSPVPYRYDSRSYALRSGLGDWVTSANPEIADELLTARLGFRNRWQTKRGRPGARKIVDWITFDVGATVFPDEDRDNFGTLIGLTDYDFRWNLGSRTSIVSTGMFDFFDGGQKVITVGSFLTRPPRGSLYLGLTILEGPMQNQILSMSYSYWMSPKWISSFGMSIDLQGDGNIGQRLKITRVGESMLISAGFNADSARDSVGVSLAIEPRFLPKGRLGKVGGARVPIAGSTGLE